MARMTVHKAVRALRKELAETKDQFAVRVSRSVTRIDHYEYYRIPEPIMLANFMRLAESRKRKDLAAVFRDALASVDWDAPASADWLPGEREREGLS